MLHIFVKLARVITMCNSNGLLFNIRVIFLILAREIVMAIVFLLWYGAEKEKVPDLKRVSVAC